MMKKILAAVFALTMVFCFTACGSSEQAESQEPEVTQEQEAGDVVGGWEIVAEPAAAELPDEVNAAFENFKGNYGDDLIPMAYYGSQVDDAIINTFNIGDYTQGEGAEAAAEPVAGGWQVAEDYTTAEIPKEAFEAYDAATAQLDGNELHPMAYLGSQLVAGTNYALLCHSTTVTAQPVSSIQVVTVYEDLDGNAQVSNICTLDLASFAETK